jgi:hypothetical protein
MIKIIKEPNQRIVDFFMKTVGSLRFWKQLEHNDSLNFQRTAQHLLELPISSSR